MKEVVQKGCGVSPLKLSEKRIRELYTEKRINETEKRKNLD